MSFINACQNFEMNNVSWSLIISSGQPFSQYHLLKKMYMNSLVLMSDLHANSCMSAPSLSVMLTIALNPSSLGRGPTKSMATESNLLSGIGRGCKGPARLEVLALFCWQSGHPGTYPHAVRATL